MSNEEYYLQEAAKTAKIVKDPNKVDKWKYEKLFDKALETVKDISIQQQDDYIYGKHWSEAKYRKKLTESKQYFADLRL